MPNGLMQDYAYDAGSRLTEIKQRSLFPFGDQFDYSYAYDKAGNRLRKAERFWEYLYTYDPTDQLTQVSFKLKSPFQNGTVLPLEGYGYDPAGNRLQGSDQEDHYVYDSGNQLTKD